MTGTRKAPALVVRRVLPVPRERVFAAWLDPRVGGKFRIVMHHGRGDADHRGEYLAIEPPARLSFTWISAYTEFLPTVVTLELLELVLTHRDLPSEHRDAISRGGAISWRSSRRRCRRRSRTSSVTALIRAHAPGVQ